MTKLTDHTVVVSGGSGLLGRAIIARLVLDGAVVVNLDVAPSDAGHDRVVDVACDVTSPDSLSTAFDEVTNRFPTLDGLVNNAYPRTDDWGARFEDVLPESISANLALQVTPHVQLTQLVAEVMKPQGRGSIVNMGSIYGMVGPDFSVYDGTTMTMPTAYSVIKAGTINLSRYLASYLGPHGIRVNTVTPGGVHDRQPSSFVERYEARVPLGRMATPEDIAPAVAFLLGDDARYVTGHNLVVDGGWTAV